MAIIFINRGETIEAVEVVRTLRESDHVILEINIMLAQVIKVKTSFLEFKRADFIKLRENLGKDSRDGNLTVVS